MSLEWRDAGRADRMVLQGFSCTRPVARGLDRRPLPHPKPWEFTVQSWIRSQTPPAGSGEAVRLGLQASTGELAAVGALSRVLSAGNQSIVKLQALAVASMHRGAGGTIADELVNETLECAAVLGHDAGATRTLVIAWVHEQNTPSQDLLRRNDFLKLWPRPDSRPRRMGHRLVLGDTTRPRLSHLGASVNGRLCLTPHESWH